VTKLAETVADALEVRLWRFGSYRTSGHRPEPNDRGVCVAVGPGGSICRRACNRGSRGWRHNPRPYGRAMHYRRRSLG